MPLITFDKIIKVIEIIVNLLSAVVRSFYGSQVPDEPETAS